ncbi:MAG: class I SAM-dependent methyltransferase [Gammaproteobacteria bacterium]|nr:class I SAM-dependent methyltransferase [Gammaproteobacteria bacterium]
MEDILEKVTLLLQKQEQRAAATQQAIGENLYRQLEALISITSILPMRHPLPPMRGWAISPDFGSLLISEILTRKPRVVLELGSGVSTILIAYCLENIGHGRAISFDHDFNFCEKSRDTIRAHKLGNIAEVVHAPLKEVQLKEGSWDWYDTARIAPDIKIDLLVIDGPPGQIQDISRYPALPLLHEYFSAEIVILLDDAARADEKSIIEMWTREFPDFEHEYIPVEKGAAVLRRVQ